VELKLPLGVMSKVDVARIMRELNALDDFFTAAKVRETGAPVKPPHLTRSLNQLAHDNGFNLLDDGQRKELQVKLNMIIGKAPLLHISFATEPTPRALERIIIWLRDNIHPQALLQVGLQPTIAAGCVLRTPNLLFDMSVRNYLKREEPYLMELIRGVARER